MKPSARASSTKADDAPATGEPKPRRRKRRRTRFMNHHARSGDSEERRQYSQPRIAALFRDAAMPWLKVRICSRACLIPSPRWHLPAAEPFLQKTNLFAEETDGFRLYRIPGNRRDGQRLGAGLLRGAQIHRRGPGRNRNSPAPQHRRRTHVVAGQAGGPSRPAPAAQPAHAGGQEEEGHGRAE